MELTSKLADVALANAARGEQWLEAHLSPAERDGLQRQGFVHTRALPSGTRAANLRFRDAQGRQRCRYIGTDPQLIADVAAAIERRRRSVRLRRELELAAQQTARELRALVKEFAATLPNDDWTQHGWGFRRRPDPRPSATTSTSPRLRLKT